MTQISLFKGENQNSVNKGGTKNSHCKGENQNSVTIKGDTLVI